jgi:hypothetical protein
VHDAGSVSGPGVVDVDVVLDDLAGQAGELMPGGYRHAISYRQLSFGVERYFTDASAIKIARTDEVYFTAIVWGF